MRLTTTTDYAVRFLCSLASADGKIQTSEKLSQVIGTSDRYVTQIGSKLKKSGFVRASRGYALRKKPKDISIWDVVCVMENQTTIMKCLETGHTEHDMVLCPAHNVYAELQKMIEKYLSEITLEDLIKSG